MQAAEGVAGVRLVAAFACSVMLNDVYASFADGQSCGSRPFERAEPVPHATGEREAGMGGTFELPFGRRRVRHGFWELAGCRTHVLDAIRGEWAVRGFSEIVQTLLRFSIAARDCLSMQQSRSLNQLAVADDAIMMQPTMRTLQAQRQFLDMTCAVAIDLDAAQYSLVRIRATEHKFAHSFLRIALLRSGYRLRRRSLGNA
jgi:hypothetical protein